MEDLSISLQDVYNTKDLEAKREAVIGLIKASSGKIKTKNDAILAVKKLSKTADMDKLATNYMLSGEGMKVL